MSPLHPEGNSGNGDPAENRGLTAQGSSTVAGSGAAEHTVLPVQAAKSESAQQNAQPAQTVSTSGTNASAEDGTSVAQDSSFIAPKGPVPTARVAHSPLPPSLLPPDHSGMSGVTQGPVPNAPSSSTDSASGAAEHAASSPPAPTTSAIIPFWPPGEFFDHARFAKDEVKWNEGQKAAEPAKVSVQTRVSQGVMYVVTEDMTSLGAERPSS